MLTPKSLIVVGVVIAAAGTALLVILPGSVVPELPHQRAEGSPEPQKRHRPPAARVENQPRWRNPILPQEMRRDFEMQVAGYEAAQAGIEILLAKLADLDEEDRDAFLHGAFTFAAAGDASEALVWVGRLPLGETRNRAMLTLLVKWSGSSTAAIIDAVDAGSGGVAHLLGGYLLRQGLVSPEEVAAFVHDSVIGRQRAELIGEAAAKLAKTDPAKAFALGEGLGDNPVFLERFAKGWAAHDPEAMWRWAGQIADQEMRAKLQLIAVTAAGGRDPAGALRLLAEMSPEDENRRRAIEQLGASLARRSPKSALDWAGAIPDPDIRAFALDGVRQVAPVGIGVALGQIGEDGILIADVLPGGPASLAGTLAAGDRIVAVADADGNWLEVGKMDMMDIISHVRGEPDTDAWLRVRGKDGGPDRTVTITRQQLIPEEPLVPPR